MGPDDLETAWAPGMARNGPGMFPGLLIPCTGGSTYDVVTAAHKGAITGLIKAGLWDQESVRNDTTGEEVGFSFHYATYWLLPLTLPLPGGPQGCGLLPKRADAKGEKTGGCFMMGGRDGGRRCPWSVSLTSFMAMENSCWSIFPSLFRSDNALRAKRKCIGLTQGVT